MSVATARTTGVAVAPLPATRPAGAGTIVPLVKAIWHLLLVREALHNDWDMSLEDAHREIEESMLHVNAFSMNEFMMTNDTVAVIKKWVKDAGVYRNDMHTKYENRTPRATFKSVFEDAPLKELITNSWQLLARLDLELTGQTADNIDPGTAR
jgi:hypothetical protein